MKRILFALLVLSSFAASSQIVVKGYTAVLSSPNGSPCVPTTPNAPTLSADDAANTLSASHALGAGEILYSINGGSYQQYTGTISVGDVDRSGGYFTFKTKAATCRNESPVAQSPGFTASGTSPPAFSPASLPYSEALYTPQSIIVSGGNVTRWANVINADTSKDLITQTTSKPIYVAGAINGLAAVKSTGTQYMYAANAANTEYSRYSIYTVVRPEAGNGNDNGKQSSLLDGNGNGNGYNLLSRTDNTGFFANFNSSASVDVPVNTWRILKLTMQDYQTKISTNTGQSATFVQSDSNLIPRLIALFTDQGFGFHGQVAYLYTNYGPVDPSDQNRIMRYLGNTFNITVDSSAMEPEGLLAYHAVPLQNKTTTGSIALNSNLFHPSVSNNSLANKYKVGDWLIAGLGTEPSINGRAGGNLGTIGGGGSFPSPDHIYNTIAAMNADVTRPGGAWVSNREDGKIYQKINATSSYWVQYRGYTGLYINPFAYYSKILAISTDGLSFTMKDSAKAPVTNAPTYYDNWDTLYAYFTKYLDVQLPAGEYAVHMGMSAKWKRATMRVKGAPNYGTKLFSPNGSECVSFLNVGTNSRVSDLYLQGNFRNNGFTFFRYTYPLDGDAWYNPFTESPGIAFNRPNCIGERLKVVDAAGYALRIKDSGSAFNHSYVQLTQGGRGYNGWYIQTEGGRNSLFQYDTLITPTIVHGWETFSGTNAKFLHCTSLNGMFAANSASGTLVDSCDFTFSDNSAPSSGNSDFYSWWNYGYAAFTVNAFIARELAGSFTAKHTTVTTGWIDGYNQALQGWLFAAGTPKGSLINCTYNSPATIPAGTEYTPKAVTIESRFSLIDTLTITGAVGFANVYNDQNYNVQMTNGNNSGTIKHLHTALIRVSDSVKLIDVTASRELAIQSVYVPPTPTAGGTIAKIITAGTDPGPTVALEQYDGVMEHDLLYVNNEYYWAHSVKGTTVNLHAPTLDSLYKAPIKMFTAKAIEFPTIQYDSTTGKWHEWGLLEEGAFEEWREVHFVANTFDSLTLVPIHDTVGTSQNSRFDLSVRRAKPGLGFNWLGVYVGDDATQRKIRLIKSNDLNTWTEINTKDIWTAENGTVPTLSTYNNREDADPMQYWDSSGKLFIMHGGYDGSDQVTCTVEIDQTTWKAKTGTYRFRYPTTEPETRYGRNKIFNPVILQNGPANTRGIYYSHNADIAHGPDSFFFIPIYIKPFSAN